jgi:hypothetical protein
MKPSKLPEILAPTRTNSNNLVCPTYVSNGDEIDHVLKNYP